MTQKTSNASDSKRKQVYITSNCRAFVSFPVLLPCSLSLCVCTMAVDEPDVVVFAWLDSAVKALAEMASPLPPTFRLPTED